MVNFGANHSLYHILGVLVYSALRKVAQFPIFFFVFHFTRLPSPYSIFGYGDETASDIIYANWLSLCLAAVKGVEMYSPAAKEWKQAHSQARFVLLQVRSEMTSQGSRRFKFIFEF